MTGYKRGGLPGLLRRSGADRGKRKTISTRLREAVENLALERQPLRFRLCTANDPVRATGRGSRTKLLGVCDVVLSLPKNLPTLALQVPANG